MITLIFHLYRMSCCRKHLACAQKIGFKRQGMFKRRKHLALNCFEGKRRLLQAWALLDGTRQNARNKFPDQMRSKHTCGHMLQYSPSGKWVSTFSTKRLVYHRVNKSLLRTMCRQLWCVWQPDQGFHLVFCLSLKRMTAFPCSKALRNTKTKCTWRALIRWHWPERIEVQPTEGQTGETPAASGAVLLAASTIHLWICRAWPCC